MQAEKLFQEIEILKNKNKSGDANIEFCYYCETAIDVNTQGGYIHKQTHILQAEYIKFKQKEIETEKRKAQQQQKLLKIHRI